MKVSIVQRAKEIVEQILYITHIGIPEKNCKSIEQGWEDYYWKTMKEYFSK